ncbi:MAG: DUF2799 domain-containing protein [Pseudomonadota bacterium]
MTTARSLTLLLAWLALTLCGCVSVPDCSSSLRNAEIDGQAGRPLDDSLDPACAAEARNAWQQGLTTYCSAANAFTTGHSGQAAAVVCDSDAYRKAYGLGALLHEKQTELSIIERDIARLEADTAHDHDDALRALRGRQVVIERDLPDLITLAQLEGWLPVSAVPAHNP